jgi:hypothetical protein
VLSSSRHPWPCADQVIAALYSNCVPTTAVDIFTTDWCVLIYPYGDCTHVGVRFCTSWLPASKQGMSVQDCARYGVGLHLCQLLWDTLMAPVSRQNFSSCWYGSLLLHYCVVCAAKARRSPPDCSGCVVLFYSSTPTSPSMLFTDGCSPFVCSGCRYNRALVVQAAVLVCRKVWTFYSAVTSFTACVTLVPSLWHSSSHMQYWLLASATSPLLGVHTFVGIHSLLGCLRPNHLHV